MVVTTPRPRRSRLDQLLVDRGLVESRSRAQALVLAGKVRVGDGDAARRDLKPGDQLASDAPIAIDQPEPYVSRGGHKLAAALDAFGVDPRDLVALDAGASTGGFTDVLLQRGARRVYALDVGRGQLAESLRHDRRVVSHERTNVRDLTASTLPEPCDLAVIDVSFISLAKVLGPIRSALRPDAPMIALVKPQFEVGKGQTDRGVVRDPLAHARVLRDVARAAAAAGIGMHRVIASPILGPEGNREFLAQLVPGPGAPDLDAWISAVTGT